MTLTLKLSDLPEVSFAEKDINKILTDMISGYEKAYFEQSGQRKKLYPGDPIRIWLYSQALRELQLRILIDDAAKQNLLKYARGNNLKNLGAFTKTDPFELRSAKVSIKYKLSQAQPINEVIPKGNRTTPGNEIYFEVTENVLVPAGVTEVIVTAECTEVGTIGNGFTPGQINILVDPLPWIESVENIDQSQGGLDEEDEENYRQRIHLAPEGFSVAGPEGAYEYFARQFSPLIHDVRISSPSDGVVDMRLLLKNGEIPTETFIQEAQSFLGAKDKRPLTDKLQVSIPDVIAYNIDVTYYIRSEDVDSEDLIKVKVLKAINDYVIWQRSRIGRDINPSELTTLVRMAGAKRILINSPMYTAIGKNDLAVVEVTNVIYGGLEDE